MAGAGSNSASTLGRASITTTIITGGTTTITAITIIIGGTTTERSPSCPGRNVKAFDPGHATAIHFIVV
jgi:hypothetical protein